MTNDRSIFLVDTNVLVYGFDVSEPAKRRVALDLYETLLDQGSGALSAQILGELFNALTRRLKPPLPAEQAEQAVLDLRRDWTVFDIESQLVIDAVRAVRQYQLSYFDALIWSTARHHDIPFILTEDFSSGQIIETVQIINPFAPNFDVRELT